MDNVINIDKYRPNKEGLPILIPHSVLICSCSQDMRDKAKGWDVIIFQMETGAAMAKLVCRSCGVIVDSNDGMIKHE